MEQFDMLWELYPMKDGKKSARKSYISSVKTDKDKSNIAQALINYKNHLANNPWKRPKNGSTWFGNWEDWVNWQEAGTYDPLADKGIFREVE